MWTHCTFRSPGYRMSEGANRQTYTQTDFNISGGDLTLSIERLFTPSEFGRGMNDVLLCFVFAKRILVRWKCIIFHMDGRTDGRTSTRYVLRGRSVYTYTSLYRSYFGAFPQNRKRQFPARQKRELRKCYHYLEYRIAEIDELWIANLRISFINRKNHIFHLQKTGLFAASQLCNWHSWMQKVWTILNPAQFSSLLLLHCQFSARLQNFATKKEDALFLYSAIFFFFFCCPSLNRPNTLYQGTFPWNGDILN